MVMIQENTYKTSGIDLIPEERIKRRETDE